MSQGKYSPFRVDGKEYIYNCYGQPPAPYSGNREEWDEKTMFADYDDEGYDQYGYSAFDAKGNFVPGRGIDRRGYTEMQYMEMTLDEFYNV